jgi:hypothetical protein
MDHLDGRELEGSVLTAVPTRIRAATPQRYYLYRTVCGLSSLCERHPHAPCRGATLLTRFGSKGYAMDQRALDFQVGAGEVVDLHGVADEAKGLFAGLAGLAGAFHDDVAHEVGLLLVHRPALADRVEEVV